MRTEGRSGESPTRPIYSHVKTPELVQVKG